MLQDLLNFDIGQLDEDMDEGIEEVSFETAVNDIAIIGISANLPMAEDAGQFWHNLQQGRDCVRPFPEGRQRDIDSYLKYMRKPGGQTAYSSAAYLEDIAQFDYRFFRLSPKEVGLMDPNQRLFLESAWKTIEDAGYGGKRIAGSRTGVFLGYTSMGEYNYQRIINEVEPASLSISVAGNLPAIIPSRISNLLNLRGPSVVMDTACSSSLVALHFACQSLRNKECDMAIAGSVKINLVPVADAVKVGFESSIEKARTFDDESDGTGSGEGVVSVLMKPLGQAIEDGDHIYAVIKGSAINQDGESLGITVPNPEAQEDVIVRAWQDAGVDPETITYMEAHGTGTRLGDPIEIKAIQQAFARYTDRKQFCAISALKTNIGHLDHAAGIAGLLKAVLSLKHKQLPPSLHFVKPNREISFESSPVYVNRRLVPWDTGGLPRRCGVSAFGLSGTNCHVVLEEAPEQQSSIAYADYPQLFALSAKSEYSLKHLISDYVKLLRSERSPGFNDLCFTANTGRGHYQYRLAVIAWDAEDLAGKLEAAAHAGLDAGHHNGLLYGYHKTVSQRAAEPQEVTEQDKRRWSAEADGVLSGIPEFSEGIGERLLLQLAQYYVQGAEVNWEELYKGQKRSKVSLPTYPFERNRCWIDIPEVSEGIKDGIFYEAKWMQQNLAVSPHPAAAKTALVFMDRQGLGDEVQRKLSEDGIRVITVESGDRYEKQDGNRYTIREDEEDYKRLIADLGIRASLQIVHLLSLRGDGRLDDLASLQESQHYGVRSLFFLTKALMNQAIQGDIELVVVAQQVHAVTNLEQELSPQYASLLGLGKVLRQEYPQLKCKGLDIDEHTPVSVWMKELGLRDLASTVSYRDGRRYVQQFQHAGLNRTASDPVQIHSDGIYVITGGTGGLGLETAKYLAGKSNVNIALINRSAMPDRSQWEALLADGQDARVVGKIRDMMEIEALGARVVAYSADIADYAAMSALLDDLRESFGPIRGVIHSAGVAGSGIVMQKEESVFFDVLRPKVQGTWVLDRLTENDPLDFFVMYSSIAGVFGGAGQSDYTAANAFMDAYAGYRQQRGRRTLSINWPAWKEAGMAVEHQFHQKQNVFKAIETAKAMNCFEAVLNRKLTNIVIAELNEQVDMSLLDAHLPIQLSEQIITSFKQTDVYNEVASAAEFPVVERERVKVELKGRPDKNYTPLEQHMGQIWGEVLGLHEIDIYDPFHELGGDSIIAVNVASTMNNSHIPVKVADIIAHQTVFEVAARIQEEHPDLRIEALDMDGKQDKARSLKVIDTIVGNEDTYNWEQLNCFFKPVAIQFESFHSGNYELFLFYSTFFTTFLPNMSSAMMFEPFTKPWEPITPCLDRTGLKGKLGIEMVELQFTSEEDFHDKIRKELNSGFSLLVPGDLFGLVYNANYLQEPHEHYFIIKGYDLDRNIYFILDNMHIDGGATALYRDFTVRCSDMYAMSRLYFKHLFPNLPYQYFWTLRKGQQKVKPFTYLHALAEHNTLMKEINDGSSTITYLEQELMKEIETQRHVYRCKGVAYLANSKFVYYDILIKFLSLCNISAEEIQSIKTISGDVFRKWTDIRMKLFERAGENNFEFADIELLVEENIGRERAFRERFIGIIDGMDMESMIRDMETRSENDKFVVRNNNKAAILRDNDSVEIIHEASKTYDTWIVRDDAPQLLIYPDGHEDFGLELELAIHNQQSRTFHSGLVLKMESGRKYLFGNYRAESTVIYCPENQNHQLVYEQQVVQLASCFRIEKKDGMITFMTRNSAAEAWISIYTISADEPVLCVGLFSKTWEPIDHRVTFTNINYEALAQHAITVEAEI
ncbi:SDR family NAD(P)-dependent oxidoreductase [Paenibacillus oenotherae]|uniref:SDR family NAD(P)-dependent oxidoreductase n=1 Tax=Paenibacillus oenotherae TaxID=1435645 RepID=A0ABS7DBT3_9BACL|nr:beta-ketoacyl synthase N-terminal-like domain-containing protein [Paenibacillus oenotherae]MBW7476952.1 SDR family NAD(P)-dependent oxidoreductase [Paenibacillus oenotherae]